ncbi:MAG: hypothetical protein EOO67_13430 [Microbacterium sp.]|nr:MAG: hypothetical protein EOO67_13430 [Microbacterium sp.]
MPADGFLAMTTARRLLHSTLGRPPRTLYDEMPLARRAWETVGCAAVSGAVTGLTLGWNLWFYLATAGLASVAGIPAATQHRTLRGAVARTTVGGFVWAGAVLVVFLLGGNDAVTTLPDPVGWYLVLATLPATAVGWGVWTYAHRLHSVHLEVAASQPARTHLPVVPVPLTGEAAA